MGTFSSRDAALTLTNVGHCRFLLILITTLRVAIVCLGGTPLSTPRNVICSQSNNNILICHKEAESGSLKAEYKRPTHHNKHYGEENVCLFLIFYAKANKNKKH